MLRLTASIHTGAITAYDGLRILAPGGTLTQLGEALAPSGGSSRPATCSPLSTMRPTGAASKAMRNLNEGRHDLGRHVFHGLAPPQTSDPGTVTIFAW